LLAGQRGNLKEQSMERKATIDEVQAIMIEFADQTGLSTNQKPPRRYLWTDAFAVCNFLTLYRQTVDERYRRLALDLVDQVHAVLGRHREDDPRTGGISGLDEVTGATHPTAGGLRIGKTLNERKPDEPYDERSEWDRDGQYFHYLTKWMHALERVGTATAEPTYIRWAMELAKAAHAAFAYVPVAGGATRMYWKMSIDLSHPLVPSMGLHDPLDAFVTYNELCTYARKCPGGTTMLDLNEQIAETAAMCEEINFTTADPLGIGGLLFDACRATQMTAGDNFEPPALVEALLRSSKFGLDAFLHNDPLNDPVDYRLAFRELGLSIGLRAIERMQDIIENNRSLFNDSLFRKIESLTKYVPLSETIERFWRDPAHQQSASWGAHRDINMVMLATSLIPEDFLSI
jgi:hypothetical protein